jgi:hypothetical protein
MPGLWRLGPEEMRCAPDVRPRSVGVVGVGGGRFADEGRGDGLGVAGLGDGGEGGEAGGVEALMEADVFQSEALVLALEGEDAFLGFDDEVADGAGVAAVEGPGHFHQFLHQGGGIHRARSWRGWR